jgi:ATP-dependent RNA helicase RhlE
MARALKAMGHNAAEIHSDRSLNQRTEALEGFKKGKYRILVATDVASRGIDVKNIELVINYDLPEDPENYVHRIGRTARAGQGGRAISFAMPDQGSDVKNIEKLIKTALPVLEHPEFPKERFVEPSGYPSHRQRRPHGGRNLVHARHNTRRGSGHRRPAQHAHHPKQHGAHHT